MSGILVPRKKFREIIMTLAIRALPFGFWAFTKKDQLGNEIGQLNDVKNDFRMKFDKAAIILMVLAIS